MSRLSSLALACILLGVPAQAADLPVAPPPKPAAVRPPGVRLVPPGGKFWLANRLVDPDAEGFRFTHGGRRLTAGFDDGPRRGRLVSWDLRHPDRPPAIEPELDGGPALWRLSPDARVGLGFADPEGPSLVLGFFNPGTGRSVRQFDPPENPEVVSWRSGVYSGDGRRFFAARLLNPEAGFESWAPLTVWDTRAGRRVAQLTRTAGYDLQAVSHDGSAVFVSCRVKVLGAWLECVGVWGVDNNRCRWARPPLRGEENDPRWSTTVFSADGTRLITVFHGHPGDPVLAPLRRIGVQVPDVIARITDARTGRLIREVVGPGRAFHRLIQIGPEFFQTVGVPRAFVVAPDGRMAALADYDGSVYLWDLDADRHILRFRPDGGAAQMVFSPDGRTLATCSGPGEVWLYTLPDRNRP